jgi:hypothetical protein
MIYSKVLPIMPKENRSTMASYHHSSNTPYTNPAFTESISAAGQRSAAIWSTADDEILLQARASGLNWQPIATRHFPNKTANACRKRHERLVERRHVEDWDTHKLELLAQEYMACRKEMWEILASRLGERWGVIEAKVSTPRSCCMIISNPDISKVHGERPQDLADGSSNSTPEGDGRQPLHGGTRYFRPQQRLGHWLGIRH